jgi:hypothetical protein
MFRAALSEETLLPISFERFLSILVVLIHTQMRRAYTFVFLGRISPVLARRHCRHTPMAEGGSTSGKKFGLALFGDWNGAGVASLSTGLGRYRYFCTSTPNNRRDFLYSDEGCRGSEGGGRTLHRSVSCMILDVGTRCAGESSAESPCAMECAYAGQSPV